jgi:hypothetical protein
VARARVRAQRLPSGAVRAQARQIAFAADAAIPSRPFGFLPFPWWI